MISSREHWRENELARMLDDMTATRTFYDIRGMAPWLVTAAKEYSRSRREIIIEITSCLDSTIRVDFDFTKLPGMVEAVDRATPEIYRHLSNGGDNAILNVRLKFGYDDKVGFACKPTLQTTLSQPEKQDLRAMPVIREDGRLKMDIPVQGKLELVA